MSLLVSRIAIASGLTSIETGFEFRVTAFSANILVLRE